MQAIQPAPPLMSVPPDLLPGPEAGSGGKAFDRVLRHTSGEGAGLPEEQGVPTASVAGPCAPDRPREAMAAPDGKPDGEIPAEGEDTSGADQQPAPESQRANPVGIWPPAVPVALVNRVVPAKAIGFGAGSAPGGASSSPAPTPASALTGQPELVVVDPTIVQGSSETLIAGPDAAPSIGPGPEAAEPERELPRELRQETGTANLAQPPDGRRTAAERLPSAGLLPLLADNVISVQSGKSEVPEGRPAARKTGDAPAYWGLRMLPPDAPAEPQVPARSVPPLIDPVPSGLPAQIEPDIAETAALPDVLSESPAARAEFLPLSAPSPAASVAGASSPPSSLPPRVAPDMLAVISERPDGPVEIRLSPEELGHVRVRLWLEGDSVRVTVQVERPDTLDLMRRHTDSLMQELRSAGYTGGSLTFEGWGSANGRPEQSAPPLDARQSAEAQPSSYPEPPPPSLGTGGLDLRL